MIEAVSYIARDYGIVYRGFLIVALIALVCGLGVLNKLPLLLN